MHLRLYWITQKFQGEHLAITKNLRLIKHSVTHKLEWETSPVLGDTVYWVYDPSATEKSLKGSDYLEQQHCYPKLIWDNKTQRMKYFYSVILSCGMTRHSRTCCCQPAQCKAIWGQQQALNGKIQPALQDLGWDSEPLKQIFKSTTVLATVAHKISMFRSTAALCFFSSVRHVPKWWSMWEASWNLSLCLRTCLMFMAAKISFSFHLKCTVLV